MGEPSANSLRDPVEWVLALYGDRDGEAGREIEARGWSIADVYLELGGGGPQSSELHERFAGFFNGQARGALAGTEKAAKFDYWAGMPERGAALRDEALKLLTRRGGVARRTAGVAGTPATRPDGTPATRPDPRTRSLILAHNQVDAELHAHFAAATAQDRAAATPRQAPPHGAAVCVLGMSRSGTSLTARVLNVLGVELGGEEELMAPASGSNPEGFWEHKGIADLNEEILAALSDPAPPHLQGWRWPPPLPEGWEQDPRLEPHRRAAKALLARSFRDSGLWGWKDPRNCLTLPFWQALVPGLRYVICIRHPLDVAASLAARDSMPQREALHLWLRYMSAALAHTDGLPRGFVSYEGFFSDREAQVRRLADFLGLPEPGRRKRAAIALELDEDLRHHRTTKPWSAEDAAAAELPTEAADLYADLCSFVNL